MSNIRDGDVYKTINVDDIRLEIRYGYYEDYERAQGDPVPIYPDFLSNPKYTKDGIPLVTAMQQICSSFEGGDGELGCYGCRYFKEVEDLVGLCVNLSERRL